MIHKLCVIEPLLIPHETSRTIALELTSKFVTFEITSAGQIVIEISWYVCDIITIPWPSVCLAQICRPRRAWPMSKSIILWKSSKDIRFAFGPCPQNPVLHATFTSIWPFTDSIAEIIVKTFRTVAQVLCSEMLYDRK